MKKLTLLKRGVFRTLLHVFDEALFAKIELRHDRVNSFNYFRKKASSQIFNKVLNMPL